MYQRNVYKTLLGKKKGLAKMVVIFLNFYNIHCHSSLQGQLYCNSSLEYQDYKIFYPGACQTNALGLFDRRDFYPLL